MISHNATPCGEHWKSFSQKKQKQKNKKQNKNKKQKQKQKTKNRKGVGGGGLGGGGAHTFSIVLLNRAFTVLTVLADYKEFVSNSHGTAM